MPVYAVERKKKKYLATKKHHRLTSGQIAEKYGVGVTTARKWQIEVGYDPGEVQRAKIQAKRDRVKGQFLMDWEDNVRDDKFCRYSLSHYARQYKCLLDDIKLVVAELNLEWLNEPRFKSVFKDFQPTMDADAAWTCRQMNAWK